jgi:hypothetical protein
LPLAFRIIYFKIIPEDQRKMQAYRVDRWRSSDVLVAGFDKPVSRI